jgi:hypothetical protein
VHVRAHRGRREELAHAPLRTGRRAYGPSLPDNGGPLLPDDVDRHCRITATVISDKGDRYIG